MTHLSRVAQLWASLVVLVLHMNVQSTAGSPQQHFLLRNLEPIFREDLIPSKNRSAFRGGAYVADNRDFPVFNPHGGFGSRIAPHSHLVLFLGGSAAARDHHRKRLPPAPRFNGNFHAAEVGQGSPSATDKRGAGRTSPRDKEKDGK